MCSPASRWAIITWLQLQQVIIEDLNTATAVKQIPVTWIKLILTVLTYCLKNTHVKREIWQQIAILPNSRKRTKWRIKLLQIHAHNENFKPNLQMFSRRIDKKNSIWRIAVALKCISTCLFSIRKKYAKCNVSQQVGAIPETWLVRRRKRAGNHGVISMQSLKN